jgi:SAM-dependent methyltransferase
MPSRASDAELLPPESMLGMFGGAEGFVEDGKKWARYFMDQCALRPDEQVLDVGCGAGRMAVALGPYLNQGAYEGLDVLPDQIGWCKENITPRWPNFRFQLADVHKFSHPKGLMRAKDYTFPYEDERFDFVFLISVFTHMLPEDVEHYFSEIARVLKRGGRCLISFLFLNEESLPLLEAGKSKVPTLEHDFGDYRVHSQVDPEWLVAYREEFVLSLYEKTGLRISSPIHYGSWPGREVPEEESFMLLDYVHAHRPSE